MRVLLWADSVIPFVLRCSETNYSTILTRSVACCLFRNTCSRNRTARNWLNRFSSALLISWLRFCADEHFWMRSGTALIFDSDQSVVHACKMSVRSSTIRGRSFDVRTKYEQQCTRFKLSRWGPWTNSNPCPTGNINRKMKLCSVEELHISCSWRKYDLTNLSNKWVIIWYRWHECSGQVVCSIKDLTSVKASEIHLSRKFPGPSR